jgi:hypothetical protein
VGRRSKGFGEEIFYTLDQAAKYKMQSGNLELVTIIECVSADGESIAPSFVFQSKEFCPEWFEVQSDIWWVFLMLQIFCINFANYSLVYCVSTSENG